VGVGVGKPERKRSCNDNTACRALMPDASGKSRDRLKLLIVPQTEDILHVEQGSLRSMPHLQHAERGVSARSSSIVFSYFHFPKFSFIWLAIM
jgi:hypothetical protein